MICLICNNHFSSEPSRVRSTSLDARICPDCVEAGTNVQQPTACCELCAREHAVDPELFEQPYFIFTCDDCRTARQPREFYAIA
jgi:hypothetical protein